MATRANNKTLQFIEAIHQRPELWDTNHSAYNDKIAQKNGWEEVADEFHITSEEAQSKFRYLQTTINDEHKRNRKDFTNDAAEPFYDAMKFALSSNDQSHSSRSCPQQTIMKSEKNSVAISVTIPSRSAQSIDKEEKMPATCHRPPAQQYNKSQQHPNKSIRQETTIEFINGCNRKRRHKLSGFVQYVSSKLNSYDDFTRSHVEFRISKILFEADMKMLDQNAYNDSSSGNETSRFVKEVVDTPLGSQGSSSSNTAAELNTSGDETSVYPSGTSSAYNTEVVIKPDGFSM